jgi:hypothetical protein
MTEKVAETAFSAREPGIWLRINLKAASMLVGR